MPDLSWGDAQETLLVVQHVTPVMFENLRHVCSSGKRKGGYVLYMDGHVEFVEWGTFPMTDVILEAFYPLE